MVGKTEWEAIKGVWGNRCAICGYPENKVRGPFEKVHLKAKTRGGSTIIPGHHVCHTRFDKGELTDSELEKIGLSREIYLKMLPKKSAPKPISEIEKMLKVQKKETERMIRVQKMQYDVMRLNKKT
jgi:hypothetical protein